MQERLLALHFDPGAPDGIFDTLDDAVGVGVPEARRPPRGRHGHARAVAGRCSRRSTPRRSFPRGAPDRVEIDLPRQVLLTYQGGNIVLISHISTGRSARWPTPGGDYALHVAGQWLAHVVTRAPLQPGVLQPRHRDARRAERAEPAGVARLRAHPDAHREVLPEPRGEGRARVRAGWLPRVHAALPMPCDGLTLTL